MSVDRERKIRERAFAIWVNEEMVDGRDREHWLEAEKQIDKEEAEDEIDPKPPLMPKKGPALN
jgi:Protein of unknown function (DUF2934)